MCIRDSFGGAACWDLDFRQLKEFVGQLMRLYQALKGEVRLCEAYKEEDVYKRQVQAQFFFPALDQKAVGIEQKRYTENCNHNSAEKKDGDRNSAAADLQKAPVCLLYTSRCV